MSVHRRQEEARRREELKRIRTAQKPKKSTRPIVIRDRDTARRTIPKIRKQMDTLSDQIEQAAKLREQVKNDRAKVQETLRNTKINARKYTASSVDRVIQEATAYLQNTKNADADIESYIKGLMTSRASYNKGITDIEDWIEETTEYMDKYGEELREAVIEKGAGKGYTPKEIYEMQRELVIERKAGKATPAIRPKKRISRAKVQEEITDIRITDDEGLELGRKTLQKLQPVGKTYHFDVIGALTKLKEDFKDKGGVEGTLKDFTWDFKHPQKSKARLDWIGTNLGIGALQTIPYFLGGVAGYLVAGPAGSLFIPAAMMGLTVPKVTTQAQKKQWIEYTKKHPEYLEEAILQGAGSLLVYGAFRYGTGKITQYQEAKLKKYFTDHPLEDYWVPEEQLWNYPQQRVDYEKVLMETRFLPKEVNIALDTVENPAALISRGYKRYSVLPFKDGKYVLVITGNDIIPVDASIPSKPSVIYKPEDIAIFKEIISHEPTYANLLKDYASKGYHVPTWLGIAPSKLTSSQIKKALDEAGISKNTISATLPELRKIPELTLRDLEILIPRLKKGSMGLEDIELEFSKLHPRKLVLDIKGKTVYVLDQPSKELPIQDLKQEEMQELRSILSLKPIQPPPPPEFEEKGKMILVPKTRGIKERRQKPRPGEEESYTVKFTDYEGRSESHEVTAKGFYEAYMKAYRARRRRTQLLEVDIIKRS